MELHCSQKIRLLTKPQYCNFSCPSFSTIRNISVATLALLMNRPGPHSSAVPFKSSFPFPPIDFEHNSPTTCCLLLDTGIESSVRFNTSPSCKAQILDCVSVAKHCAGGVVAPVPRGSKPRISNSWPTTLDKYVPRSLTSAVPEPPGPPGLTKIVPTECQYSASISKCKIYLYSFLCRWPV